MVKTIKQCSFTASFISSLGHDGDEPVQELGPVLRLDLDDVGVPAVEEVAGARVHHGLLEGLGRRGGGGNTSGGRILDNLCTCQGKNTEKLGQLYNLFREACVVILLLMLAKT